MNNESIKRIQKQIGYQFRRPSLLEQAFTRKTYATEHPGTDHNEVLEFYGDKVLEFAVMKKLSERFGEKTVNGQYRSSKSEGELTEIKIRLVEKKMLAHRMECLGFSGELIMGKGDILQNVSGDESVREDLFEAIIGAVAIDSGWNAEVIERVVGKMLETDRFLSDVSEEHTDDGSTEYVGLLQQWCQKTYGTLPQYDFDEYGAQFMCRLFITDEYDIFEGSGSSKKDARADAAKAAYTKLVVKERSLSCKRSIPIAEIGVPEKERAINQLQELFQKGLIDEPVYSYDQTYAVDGKTVWMCECSVSGKNRLCCRGSFLSKRQGKKEVAYEMLRCLQKDGTFTGTMTGK